MSNSTKWDYVTDKNGKDLLTYNRTIIGEGLPVAVQALNALEADRERLLVLASKWCDRNHHDWEEITGFALTEYDE